MVLCFSRGIEAGETAGEDYDCKFVLSCFTIRDTGLATKSYTVPACRTTSARRPLLVGLRSCLICGWNRRRADIDLVSGFIDAAGNALEENCRHRPDGRPTSWLKTPPLNPPRCQTRVSSMTSSATIVGLKSSCSSTQVFVQLRSYLKRTNHDHICITVIAAGAAEKVWICGACNNEYVGVGFAS